MEKIIMDKSIGWSNGAVDKGRKDNRMQMINGYGNVRRIEKAEDGPGMIQRIRWREQRIKQDEWIREDEE
jgi:hypothetical protein